LRSSNPTPKGAIMARRPGVRDRAPRAIFLTPGTGRQLFAQPSSGHRLVFPVGLLVVVSTLLLALLLLLGDLWVAVVAALGLSAVLLALGHWLRPLRRRP